LKSQLRLTFTDLFREKAVSGSMSGFGLYDGAIRWMTEPRFKVEEMITRHTPLDDLLEKG
jgi:hypothetical protein